MNINLFLNPLFDWFPSHPILVAVLSIILNIFIALSGILPSAFITVGTVGFFGFKIGLLVLIVGEASGAIISFILYRKGLYKLGSYSKFDPKNYKFLKKLRRTSGISAFSMVILLRLLPFVPSGAVTLTATLSKMGLLSFSIASTLGKIPALFIEAYSVFYVFNLNAEWQIGIIIFIGVLFLFYLLMKKENTKN